MTRPGYIARECLTTFTEHLTAIIIRVGAVPQDLDRAALSLDVADFIAHYGGQSLENFDLSGALNEMTEMIRRYRISLPVRIVMKVVVFRFTRSTLTAFPAV